MTTKLINKKTAAGVLALLAAALMAQATPPVFNLIGSSQGFVAIDSNGIVYVADSLANEVISYTPPASPGGSWIQTVLYQFAGGAFSAQLGQLVVGPSTASGQPVLYGVTNAAGSANLGTIYSLTPPGSPGGVWTEAVLYNFIGAADSSYPIALARAANGTLFGVTAGAYNSTNSTVFMLDQPSQPAGSWTHSVIYAANYYILPGTFQGLTIGSAPKACHGLPILYGYGDTFSGTVFSLTPPTTTAPRRPLNSMAARGPRTTTWPTTGTNISAEPNSIPIKPPQNAPYFAKILARSPALRKPMTCSSLS